MTSGGTPAISIKKNVIFARPVPGPKKGLRLDIYAPTANDTSGRSAVLLVHGGLCMLSFPPRKCFVRFTPKPSCRQGAWRSGSKKEVKRQGILFARHGFVAFAINYRKAPRHVFPAQINDCQCGLAFIRDNAARFGVDKNKICAWGYSAGGHLVALLASREHYAVITCENFFLFFCSQPAARILILIRITCATAHASTDTCPVSRGWSAG